MKADSKSHKFYVNENTTTRSKSSRGSLGGSLMEPDARYFWRRATEELSASRRSLTPAARARHQHFVRLYLDRLTQMGARPPFSLHDVEAEFLGHDCAATQVA